VLYPPAVKERTHDNSRHQKSPTSSSDWAPEMEDETQGHAGDEDELRDSKPW